MIEDFKIIARQKLDPPRDAREKYTYVSAIVDIGDSTDIVSAVCEPVGFITEIILFSGKFEGKPVVGGMFACENEVRVVKCKVTPHRGNEL